MAVTRNPPNPATKNRRFYVSDVRLFEPDLDAVVRFLGTRCKSVRIEAGNATVDFASDLRDVTPEERRDLMITTQEPEIMIALQPRIGMIYAAYERDDSDIALAKDVQSLLQTSHRDSFGAIVRRRLDGQVFFWSLLLMLFALCTVASAWAGELGLLVWALVSTAVAVALVTKCYQSASAAVKRTGAVRYVPMTRQEWTTNSQRRRDFWLSGLVFALAVVLVGAFATAVFTGLTAPWFEAPPSGDKIEGQ